MVLPALLAVLAGCGSNDAGPSDDNSDKRAIALDCLTDQKGIDARLEGQHSIVLNDDKSGPRIKFFLTADEAVAATFRGEREGAEQIGSALLYTTPQISDGTEDMLKEVEDCLDDL
jgi:hypothetical protein